MVNMNDGEKLQYLFQTLGDINRLKIIKFIDKNEHSVSDIVDATNLSQPLVSHHLRILREREILKTKRNGPFIYHKLKDPRLLDAIGLFLEILNSMKGIKKQDPMFFCPPFWKNWTK